MHLCKQTTGIRSLLPRTQKHAYSTIHMPAKDSKKSLSVTLIIIAKPFSPAEKTTISELALPLSFSTYAVPDEAGPSQGDRKPDKKTRCWSSQRSKLHFSKDVVHNNTDDTTDQITFQKKQLLAILVGLFNKIRIKPKSLKKERSRTYFPATREIPPNMMMVIHARPATKALPSVVTGA